MELQKLFETQAELDQKIVEEKGLQGQDLLDKKILALKVELGELANEWRGFKFWSENREPRTKGDSFRYVNKHYENVIGYKNPLLEEYVDCLHFILSIGNAIEFGNYTMIGYAPAPKKIEHAFLLTFEAISNFYNNWHLGDETRTEIKYTIIFDLFLTLGNMLGLTEKQIEQAYYEKNEINHARQANGY